MSISIFDLENYRRISSKRIISAILPLSEKEIDEDALEIILFATENGLGCRKTAEMIAEAVEFSTDIPKTFFSIIEGLFLNEYFIPTEEITSAIETYFKRATPLFASKSEHFEETVSLLKIERLQTEERICRL